MKHGMEIVAHRGLSRDCPENTLPAFAAAAKLKLDAIEFDVHLTRDGVLVVTHDDTIERCSNGQGRVGDLTWDELRNLDFGSWKAPRFAGTRIPSLDETLETILTSNPAQHLLVEIKENDPACARRVLDRLQHGVPAELWMMTSFHLDILKLLRQLAPDCRLHGSEDHPSPPEYYRVLNSIGAALSGLTPEHVAALKKQGLRVDAWVIDTEPQWRLAQSYGVDSVTSNVAEEMLRLRAADAARNEAE